MPAPAQLASHLRVCRNIGFTESQLREAGKVLGREFSKGVGELVNSTLNKIYSVEKKVNDVWVRGQEVGRHIPCFLILNMMEPQMV